jgi:type I restriction enzyme S subunit
MFQERDILFSKLRPYLAKCIIAEVDGKCTSELLVLRMKNTGIESRFLHAFLLGYGYIMYIDASTYGAKMPRANWSFIGNSPILIPPTDEQQAIVDFLDKAVEKIDRYIAAKEAEIEKLGTLKQSIISQAVTKGLDLNAPMKDSGIPWIGDVPEHWEPRTFHSCLKVKSMTNNIDLELLSVYLDHGVIRFSDVTEKRTNATT